MLTVQPLTRFYLYAFLNGLQFTWTTWLAYVVAHNGNPGWAEAAFHLAIWLGEIPTGAVADLVGRRVSILIGLALGMLQPFLYFWIHDTLSACIVLGLSGLAGTFLSGADTALLYETASEVGGSDVARTALARSSSLQMIALAISPVIAGYLYAWQDWAPAIVRGGISLLALLLVWGMKEIKQPRTSEQRPSLWQQTRTALSVVRQSRMILLLLGFSWVYNTAHAMGGQFAQVYFPFVGLSIIATGYTFAASRIAASGGSALAERLSERWGSSVLRFGPLLLALALLGMATGKILLGVCCFLLIGLLDGFVWPIYQHRLNEELPSAQRATILSLDSSGFSILMSLLFPLAAYLQPVPLIYLAIGLFTLLFAILWLFFTKKPIRCPGVDTIG